MGCWRYRGVQSREICFSLLLILHCRLRELLVWMHEALTADAACGKVPVTTLDSSMISELLCGRKAVRARELKLEKHQSRALDELPEGELELVKCAPVHSCKPFILRSCCLQACLQDCRLYAYEAFQRLRQW